MTARRARVGGGLLTVASCLLVLLAAAQGYVSFRAQYTFVDHAKRAPIPSTLEALGLDTGAVIFALLALSLARRGRSGAVERVLNVACALGSLTMNLLAADLTSPRSVTVWVMPSALYALASDRVIAVVRRWAQASDPSNALAQDGSAWQAAGGLALWLMRLCFDVPGTVGGFRRWVLAVAPVAPGTRATSLPTPPVAAALTAADSNNATLQYATPGPVVSATPGKFRGQPQEPARALGDGLAPGETKRAAMIRLYERCGQDGDPRYGDRANSAALAGEIASRIGYHPGTARRELAKYLAERSRAVSGPQPEPDMQAVA
jgi:hypothetical protein